MNTNNYAELATFPYLSRNTNRFPYISLLFCSLLFNLQSFTLTVLLLLYFDIFIFVNFFLPFSGNKHKQDGSQSEGPPELVQHFRLQVEFTSAQQRCML
jgi:hypothetical protein